MPKNGALSVGFLFDDTLDSSDGVAQYVKTLGAWLSGQGHEVSYLVGQTKMKKWAGGQVYSMARNMPVIFNSNRLSVPLPASRRRIKEVLEQTDFDVLHVQIPHSPFMSQMVINRASPAVAVVGSFHIFPAGKLALFGSKLLRLAYGRGLKRFGRIVSVSQPAADFALQTFKVRSKISPNVVDLSRFKTKNSVKSVDILFLGRLVHRKGCEQLLRAFLELHRQIPELNLTIAGDGPKRAKLERFVDNNGLSDSVRFLGFIKESKKPALLGSAKIACFPSLYGESFGIVLIEAMAAGAGVVLGGDNPGYRSVLGGQPDSLIDPADTSSFAARLKKMLRDERLANSLHQQQQKLVRQYDVAVVGPKLVDIYRQEIAKHLEVGHN